MSSALLVMRRRLPAREWDDGRSAFVPLLLLLQVYNAVRDGEILAESPFVAELWPKGGR